MHWPSLDSLSLTQLKATIASNPILYVALFIAAFLISGVITFCKEIRKSKEQERRAEATRTVIVSRMANEMIKEMRKGGPRS